MHYDYFFKCMLGMNTCATCHANQTFVIELISSPANCRANIFAELRIQQFSNKISFHKLAASTSHCDPMQKIERVI